MNQKALLTATLLLLIGGVAAALLWRTLDDATPVRAADGPTSGETTAAVAARGAVATSDATAQPTDATSGRALAANGTAAAQRPFRENAEWIVVRVVDKDTGAAVPGAEVFWCDEPGQEAFGTDITRTSLQRSLLSRWTELVAELIGWSTTTDSDGAAKITCKGWTTIAARHDGKYGTLNVAETMLKPTNGFVLQIAADRSLRVRVVDDRGEPAAGVPVSIGCFGDGGEPSFIWNWGPSAITDADGTTTIHHLQRVETTIAEETSTGSERPKGEWRVFAMLAGHAEASAPVSIDAPTADTVELHLPPCGRVRARVEIAGVPRRSVDEIFLAWQHDEENEGFGSHPAAALPDAEGWAHFAHIPLNARFAAYTQDAGGMQAEFTGPVQRDQEVTVVLGPPAASVMLRGRLLQSTNEPLRSRQFTLDVTGTQRQQWFDLRTDPNGVFTVSLGEAMEDDRVDHLWFDVKRDGAPPLRATVANRLLRVGIDDLGDLLLHEEAPFCSGRLMSGDVPFTKKIECQVWHWIAGPDGRADWQPVPGARYHREEDGRFSFRGEAPPGRYRLTVEASLVLPMEPVEFSPGVTDLVVQVDPGHALAASVLLPDRTPWGSIGARLVATRGTTITPGLAERLWVTAWNENDGNPRWNLQWTALPAGTYTLELCAPTCGEPIVRIADLHVPGPANGDPRLEDIDLRQLLRVVRTRLLDAAGQPLENANGFVTPVNGADRWSCTFWSAEFPLIVPRTATELSIVTRDHRPTRVFCDGDRLDVKFEAWPSIEVEIADLPKLPDGAAAVVTLEPIDPVKTPYRTQWNDAGEFLPYATEASSSWLRESRGSMPIGEGKYTVSLRLEGPNCAFPLTGVAPTEILGNSRHVKITAPREEWERVMRELTAHMKAAAANGGRPR